MKSFSMSNAKKTNNIFSKPASNTPDPSDINPKRFGLKYDPPVIILEYLVASTGKLYHHNMKLLKVINKTETEIIKYVKHRHADYLQSVSDEQIKCLVEKIFKRTKASKKISEIPKKKDSENPKTDFPKSSSNTNTSSNIKLAPINISNKTTNKTSAKVWDALDDQDPFDDIFSKERPSSAISSKKPGSAIDAKKFYSQYEDVDLNKLGTDELKKEKDKMEEVFKKNVLKPGDEGYEYDLQENFDPYEENEWDLDEEDII